MNRPSNQLLNLEKLFKDEDDQDFAPLGGSNLAAIFGTPQKLADATTSPKQSAQKKSNSGRSTPQTVQPMNKTEVIVAKVVHAYKLQNGQYSLIGKLGIALTGNPAVRIYQIILYRGKQEHVSTVNLTPEFSYTIRENNYATYYDGNNENWSLLFENETSCIEFAREVGVSRFHTRHQTKIDDSVFHQNLTVDSEANDASENDEISVKCIICTNLSQPLKLDGLPTQIMNVLISQDDNWERSLLNCSKGLRRLLILPTSKQISLGPGFPRDREIIMEIEVMDINRIEDKSTSVNKPAVSSGKASILSRMAKMGQSMLPKVPTSTTTDSEDTEEEAHVKSPRRLKREVSASHSSKRQSRVSQDTSEESASISNILVPRAIVPTSVPLSHRPIITSPSFASPWPTVGPIQQQYVTMDGQYYPVHQAPIAQPIPVGMDPNLNVFLSETRTQNTEIRMGMAKIADNVHKLLDKIHVLEVQRASSPMYLQRPVHRSVDSITLEAHLNEEKFPGSENEVTNGKNPYAEVLPSVEHRSKDFEKEKRLEMELNEARELLKEHAIKDGKRDSEMRERSNEMSELYGRIQRLEKAVMEGNNALETANNLVTQLRERNALLESSILKNNGEKLLLKKLPPTTDERTAFINEKVADIKRLTKTIHRMLLTKFTGEESYSAVYIKDTLADTMRIIPGVGQQEPPPIPPMYAEW